MFHSGRLRPYPQTLDCLQTGNPFLDSVVIAGEAGAYPNETPFSGLYYKNILMIVSDDRKWSLYYSTGVIYDRHLMCFTLAL